ncbi:MAG: hypothetical protein Harvfovirus20_14 [Harvfovirus sp.]|uniref:Uncharacterized protein n=1 Tax=Harvfovirus sp. TaxID=2487768 RepID=A0A3G5A1W7_9VIRU|nr:MAG: hypothetical protein Harvfovirus20_14 [Harvfovirus sp.]
MHLNAKQMRTQSKGYLLENKIREHFSKFGSILHLDEKAVMKRYGKNVSAIDHHMSCDGRIVLIQDKLTLKKPSVIDIHHFIVCVETIKRQLPGTEIKAIYVSERKPTESALLSLQNNGCALVYSTISEKDVAACNVIESLIIKLEPEVLSFFRIDAAIDVKPVVNQDLPKTSEHDEIYTVWIDKFLSLMVTLKDMFGEDDKMIQILTRNCKRHKGKKMQNKFYIWIETRLKRKFNVHKYCTSHNHKFIKECLAELDNIILAGKKLHNFTHFRVTYPIDEKYFILAHNFGNGEEFSAYGAKNWEKLLTLNVAELQTTLDKLIKAKNSIWCMCWHNLF